MVLPISRQDLETFAPDKPNRNYSFSTGEQQQVTPYSTQGIRGAAFLAASAGVIGGFNLAKQAGYNPWNSIYSGVRTIEEMSPGKVFRTFQVGNFVSQFADQGRASLNISAQTLRSAQGSAWMEDLVHRTGGDALKALDNGLQFENGVLRTGDTVLLSNARKVTSVGNPYFSAAYSRAAGYKGLSTPQLPSHFNFGIPVKEGSDILENVYFTGGKSNLNEVVHQTRAFLGESVERANRLAAAPFGIEPFTTGLKGVEAFWEKEFGTRFTLAVRSGTATQTLGRMATKWGVAGGAAYLGYQTADWAVRNTDLLNGTIFDKGITSGIATLGVKANKTAASIADTIPGVRAYREKQEELAPGSTSLLKLAAFPLTGAMVGGGAYYTSSIINRSKAVKELMAEGLSYTQALPVAESRWLENSSSVIQNNPLTRALEKKFGKKIPFFGEITRPKGFALLGAAVLSIPILPFIPGALIPDKSAAELEEIYSGRQEVGIRKGRFWELGRSPYEGGRIDYFRPHWYARMQQDSYGKSMYGEDEPAPVTKWFKENFTYDMEMEHYRDRPYPITGAAFEDVPIIGPALSATIGRLFKPPKLMHTEEWSSGGIGSEEAVLRTPGRMGDQPERPGEKARGVPVDPNSITQVAGEQAYRLSELSGLIGFTLSSLKGAITGEAEFFDQEERLQSARRMYGAERYIWDKNMGGAAFTNELFRRMFPHRRRQIEEYNPIKNNMPNWMPGPGERGPDFQHGDPFIKIQEGELRLPGAGYAARFKELEGVDPADYPLIHRYKILQDVAPYTDRARAAEAEVMSLAKSGNLSEYEMNILAQTRKQSREKKVTKQFYDFEATSDAPDITLTGANQSRSTVAALNKILAAKKGEKIGTARSVIGGYWENLGGMLQNPLEALVPFAPGSKLLNQKSALTDYKQTQVYGPDIAFWEHPIDNFLKPFAREVAGLVSNPSIPEEVSKKRSIEEYFDILEYTKNKRLAEAARENGAGSVAGAYERIANETTVGVNPYTRDFSTLFRSMTRSERDYFGEFSGAKTQAERDEILSLVPANMRRIYTAQWEQRYADTINAALDRGLLDGQAAEDAEKDLQAFYDKKAAEGFPVTPELMSRYRNEAEAGETYADWFRRSVLIPGVMGEEGLPGADWVGWHPAIDLEEVKLKVVQNEGMDMHDFNLWPSDERSANRKLELDGGAEQLVNTVISNTNRRPQDIQAEVRHILSELGIGSNAQIYVYNVPDDEENVKIEIESSEIRTREVREILKERLDDLE
jgi:hypothetical protein